MKKLIFIFIFGFFILICTNTIEASDGDDSIISTDLIQKNFIELSKAKASTLENKIFKFLYSSTLAAVLFYIYSEAFGAISKRSSWGYSTSTISGYQAWSHSETIYNPKHIAIGLSIALGTSAFAYYQLSKDILDKYQHEELEKIIQQWDSVKHLVNPKFKILLDNISNKYKHNPRNVDFIRVSTQLKELIEKTNQ